MDTFYMFILVLSLIGGAAGFFAARAKKNEKRTWIKGMLWGFMAFFSCFNFPLFSDVSPMKLINMIIFIIAYQTIGKAAAYYYDKLQRNKVYLLSVSMVILGMVCRYLLEYGEISNVYNFTPENVIFYGIMAPLLVIVNYHLYHRFGGKK